MTSKITFSTRGFTLGELELMDKVKNGDITASIDLMVKRADQPVTREYVCSFTESEAMEAVEALRASIQTSTFLRNILKSQEPSP